MAKQNFQQPKLDSLFGATGEQIIQVVPENLRAMPGQPRTIFDAKEHAALVASVKEHGVQQPILVRPRPLAPHEKTPSIQNRQYEIVAGERRWRAATEAGLLTVPCIVRGMDDKEAFVISLTENVQRANLEAEDEVLAVERLQKEFLFTRSQIATALGQPEGWVNNRINALNAPAFIRDLLKDFRQSIGFIPIIRAGATESIQRELVAFVRNTPRVTAQQVRDERTRLEEGLKPAAAPAQPAASMAINTSQGVGFKSGGGVERVPAPESRRSSEAAPDPHALMDQVRAMAQQGQQQGEQGQTRSVLAPAILGALAPLQEAKRLMEQDERKNYAAIQELMGQAARALEDWI